MKTIESGNLLVREWNENDAADFFEIKTNPINLYIM